MSKSKSERARKIRNRGNHARQLYFDTLLLIYENKCHYCKKPVMRNKVLDRIEKGLEGDKSIVSRNHSRARVQEGDTITLYEVASIDHKVPFAKGGHNNPSNLVISCISYNAEKASK
jgi:5-methylcytosine-specific restriction endonuclease McrA